MNIQIDAPGAGDWIMSRCDAHFVPSRMRVFTTHSKDGDILGGFVVHGYNEHASIMINMAGTRPGWCTRDLLWMLFTFCFYQTTAKKVLATVRSDNYRALELDLRAGFQIETVVRDVYSEGVHSVVLYMTEENCVWLKHRPKTWVPTRDNVLLFGRRDEDAA